MLTIEKIDNISETDHGLIGIGNISYEYTSDKGFAQLKLILHDLDIVKIFTGDEAKLKWNRAIEDSIESEVNLIKRLACDSTGIPLIRLYEKSRKEVISYSRWLIMWFTHRKMNMSYKLSGELFGLDHATVIHAVKEIEKDEKYLKYEHRLWRNIFMKKLKEKELI